MDANDATSATSFRTSSPQAVHQVRKLIAAPIRYFV